ncbi:MAG: T9SS type A sorting domain-containing protein [Saprospiraceae bacterium]|nr:T9SS type A sorting domain-containing protein [Saprospiraceae bacterium]
MVVEAVHGDIEGKKFSFGIPAFGFPQGDTLTYPNHVNYSSEFQLQFNIGGALADISFLNAGEVPMITFQSPNDFFAPYEDAVLIVPTTRDPIVQVQGGLTVHRAAQSFGNNKVFIDANIDDEFTKQAMRASQQAGHEYIEGLYPIIRPLNQFGQDEGVPVQWWNKEIWDALPHPLGGTYHTQGLFGNAMMSAEQGRTYIDTIMGYFAPRAFAALDLLEYTSTKEISENDAAFVISPNPAYDQVILRSAAEKPMQDIEIYDLNGRLLKAYRGVDTHYFYLQGAICNGIYVAKVRFEEGTLAKKIMFN